LNTTQDLKKYLSRLGREKVQLEEHKNGKNQRLGVHGELKNFSPQFEY